jgi:hypothetical protein
MAAKAAYLAPVTPPARTVSSGFKTAADNKLYHHHPEKRSVNPLLQDLFIQKPEIFPLF